MKVSFYTLGCKVNQYETNLIIQKFKASGFQIVPWGDYADIFVINTCTVTNMADRKSRQILRRPKKINKDGIIVAMGCFVQSSEDNIKNIEEIDIAVGNDDKVNIVEMVKNYIDLKNKSRQNCDNNDNNSFNNKIKDSQFKISNIMDKCEFTEMGITEYSDTNRVFIKIEDGCEQYCTYCIIPYVRGRVRSRNKDNIIEEVKVLVKNGIKEIVLTGIHVASYGKDFKEDYRLIDLLEDLEKVADLKRIRLSSIEPTYFNENILNRMKNITKLCHHFHLSLQSASNNILKKMNRKYSVEEYAKTLEDIRAVFPNVILTTDIIVGFPGESEEDFEITYNNLKKFKFYKIHVFKYSRRKGTIADKMETQITEKIKIERSNRILKLSDEYMEEYMKELLNKEVEVLFEEIKDGYLIGHTSNYIMTYVDIKGVIEINLEAKTFINQIMKVKVNKYSNLKLYANLIYK